MPADPFVIKQNDTKPALRRTLKNADGTAIDLTSATAVQFHMAIDSTVKVDSPAMISDASGGIVQYDWQSGDTDTAGVYDSEFEVTFSSGDVITAPNDTYMQVTIDPDLA